MENASKALLIAAGVLIVILLIAVSMRIFNSTDTADDAQKVGESIVGSTSDASKKAIYILEDLNGKSLIKVEQHAADAKTNEYYSSYFPQNPTILLKPNTKYMLSFNYKVNYADRNVGCGIGCGEKSYILDIVYNEIYYIKNSDKKEGTFKHTFKTPSKFMVNVKENGVVVGKREITEPYLHIRFARMGTKGNCSVDISNVRFKEVE